MKKNVLYIGNYLKDKKRNDSYMFSLGHLLSQEGYSLSYASSYTNKVLRLSHMLYTLWFQKRQTDYVLIDTYSTQNFYYAVLVGKLCTWLKLPYIPILHGGNLPQRLEQSPKLCKALFHKALVNVSPSQYLKQVFNGLGYDNVVHIPNTLNIRMYPYKQRPIKSIKLFWLRSFSQIYNPIMAVKVRKILVEKGFDAELVMIGPDTDGSLKQVKTFSHDHALKIRFTGKLSKKEWMTLSELYNIFINTSDFDNTPMSVIEAMALGLPVVSTNVGGMPYLIEHEKEGLLVNPDDVEAMTRAIIKLHHNQDLIVELTTNARQKVEQFDWDVVKDLWFEVLR
jgi:glycosyltransferase involved in cell wall biosynthesis